MIYRKGNERSPELHGVRVDYRIVADEQEYAVAKRQGWHRTPADAHAAGNGKPDKNEEKRLREELAKAQGMIDAFDHDKDGRPGGSRKRDA